MPDYLLSFELNDEKNQLKIHGDKEGLEYLINALNKLVEHTKEGYFNHDHLWTEEWAGNELSSESQGGEIIKHVKIYCHKGNEFQK